MSYLVTAATDFEMQAFVEAGHDIDNVQLLVTGIGPVETTLSMSCLLQQGAGQIDGVLNFGIAGAYMDSGIDIQAGLLDICLAEQEVLGDLGICLQDRIERFSSPDLQVEDSFFLDHALLTAAGRALDEHDIAYKSGTFVTVNCASGTRQRGKLLGREFQGLCENMEGGSVARVCRQFALPCLEVRCISNMVEDRNTDNWKLKQACSRAGHSAAVVIRSLYA